MNCLVIDSVDSISKDGMDTLIQKAKKKSDLVNFEFIESWLAL